MTDETIYDQQELIDLIASELSNGNGNELIQYALESYLADYTVELLISECDNYGIDYSHCIKEG
tara:strand:+ start:234 stop:425 length:192 start_codon:yes stop_codon:yes gene_type:complete